MLHEPIPDPVKGGAMMAFTRYEGRRRDPTVPPRPPDSVRRIVPDAGAVVSCNLATVVYTVTLHDGRVAAILAPYKGKFRRSNQPARGHLPRLHAQFETTRKFIEETHGAWKRRLNRDDLGLPDTSDDDDDGKDDGDAVSMLTPDKDLKLFASLPGAAQPVYIATSVSTDSVVHALPNAGAFEEPASAMMKRAISKRGRVALYRAGLGGAVEDVGEELPDWPGKGPGFPKDEHMYQMPAPGEEDEFEEAGGAGFMDEVKEPRRKRELRQAYGSDRALAADLSDAAPSDNTEDDDVPVWEPTDTGRTEEEMARLGPFATQLDVDVAARKGKGGRRKVTRTEEGRVKAKTPGRGKKGFDSTDPVNADDTKATFMGKPPSKSWVVVLDSRAYLPYESPLVPYMVFVTAKGRCKLWPLPWGFPDRPLATRFTPDNTVEASLVFNATRQVHIMYSTGIPTAVGAVPASAVKRNGVLTAVRRALFGEAKTVRPTAQVPLQDAVFALRDAKAFKIEAARFVNRCATNSLKRTVVAGRALSATDVRSLVRVPWSGGGSEPLDCALRFHAALTGGMWELCHPRITQLMMELHMHGVDLTNVREQLRTDDGPACAARTNSGIELHVDAVEASLSALLRVLLASPMAGILRPKTHLAHQTPLLALEHLRWTAPHGAKTFRAVAAAFSAHRNATEAVAFSEGVGACADAVVRLQYKMVRPCTDGVSCAVATVSRGSFVLSPTKTKVSLEIPPRVFAVSEEEAIAAGAPVPATVPTLVLDGPALGHEGVAVVPNTDRARLLKLLANDVFMFRNVYTQTYGSKTAGEVVQAETVKEDENASLSTTELVLGCLVAGIVSMACAPAAARPAAADMVAPTHVVVLTVDDDHRDRVVMQLQRRITATSVSADGAELGGTTFGALASRGVLSVVNTGRFTDRATVQEMTDAPRDVPVTMGRVVSGTSLSVTTTSRVVFCVPDVQLWTPVQLHAALRFAAAVYKHNADRAKQVLAEAHFARTTGLLNVPKVGGRAVTKEQFDAVNVHITDAQLREYRTMVAKIRVRAPELVLTGNPAVASPRQDGGWEAGTRLARSMLLTTLNEHAGYMPFSRMPSVENAGLRIGALASAVDKMNEDTFRRATEVGPELALVERGATDEAEEDADVDLDAVVAASKSVVDVMTPRAVLGMPGACTKYLDATVRVMASGMERLLRVTAEQALDAGNCPPVQLWSPFADADGTSLPTTTQRNGSCLVISSFEDFPQSVSPPMLFGPHLREVYVAMGTRSAALASRSLAAARGKELPTDVSTQTPIYVGLGDPVQNVTGDGALYRVSEMTSDGGKACSLIPTGSQVMSDKHSIGLTSARAPPLYTPKEPRDRTALEACLVRTSATGGTEVFMQARFVESRLIMSPERAASLVGRHGTHAVVVFLSHNEVEAAPRLVFHRLASLFRAMPVGCLMVLVADCLRVVECIFAEGMTRQPSATVLDFMLHLAAQRTKRQNAQRKQTVMAARQRSAQAERTQAALAAAAAKRVAEEHSIDTAPPGAKRVRAQ